MSILVDEIDALTSHESEPIGGPEGARTRMTALLYPENRACEAMAKGFGSPSYYIDGLTWDLVMSGALLLSDSLPGSKTLRFSANPGRPIVIDDVRKVNEAAAFAAMGFLIIRVETHRNVIMGRIAREGGNPDALNHPTESEAGAIVADHYVRGDGDLKVDVDRLMARIAR